MSTIKEIVKESSNIVDPLLANLQSTKFPKTIKELKQQLENDGYIATERSVKDALEKLEKNGYDIKKVVGKEVRYGLVRFGTFESSDYYKVLGKVKVPCLMTGDWHVGCFPKGELVGFGHKIEEVKVGEKLLDTTVVETMRRMPYENEKLIEIRPMNLLSFKVTDHHPVLVIKNKKTGSTTLTKDNLQFIPAQNVQVGDWLVIKRIKEEKDIEIPLRLYKTGKNTISIKLDEPFSKFLGTYIGDGYVCNDKDKCIVLCFDTLKNKQLMTEIVNYITTILKRKVHCIQNGNYVKVMFHFRPLAEWLQSLGKVITKRIPEELFESKKSIIEAFIRGYIESEGYKTSKTPCTYINTSSKTIAYQLSILLAKIGKLPNIQLNTTKGKSQSYQIELTQNQKRSEYKVDDEYVYIPVKEIKVTPLKEPVYNLETTNNTIPCPVVTHNSKSFSKLCFNKLLEDCIKYKCKDVVMVGDLLQGLGVYATEAMDVSEPHIDRQEEQLVKLLQEFPKGTTFHVVIGNHEEKIKGRWMVGHDSLKTIAERKDINDEYDFIYYGHIAKLQLEDKFSMLLIHGGGNVPYAISYKAQKIFERLTEQPTIFAMGHIHKLMVLPMVPNKYIFVCGTLQRENSWLIQGGNISQPGWIVIRDINKTKLDTTITTPEVF